MDANTATEQNRCIADLSEIRARRAELDRLTAELDAAQLIAVGRARSSGLSWAEVAKQLDVSPQATYQRYNAQMGGMGWCEEIVGGLPCARLVNHTGEHLAPRPIPHWVVVD